MDETPLIRNGKSYISSKRAAQIFGYTNDYIGQLCRSSKVGSIMIGRDRFVDFSSISAYVESIAPNPNTSYASPTRWSRESPLTRIPTSSSTFSLTRAVLVGFVLVTVVSATIFFWETDIGRNSLAKLDSGPLIYNDQNWVSRVAGAQSAMISTANIGIFGDVKNYILDLDKRYIGLLERTQSSILAFLNKARKLALGIFGQDTGDTTESEKSSGGYATSTLVNNLVATSTNDMSQFYSMEDIIEIARAVANEEISKTVDYSARATLLNQGLVTIPISGDTDTSALIKQIRNNYSDEVGVTLDSTLTGGIIRPVFKKSTDDSYMFVIVPINKN